MYCKEVEAKLQAVVDEAAEKLAKINEWVEVHRSDVLMAVQNRVAAIYIKPDYHIDKPALCIILKDTGVLVSLFKGKISFNYVNPTVAYGEQNKFEVEIARLQYLIDNGLEDGRKILKNKINNIKGESPQEAGVRCAQTKIKQTVGVR